MFILKTVTERAILSKFWWKLKMFILKIITDGAILCKFWTLWVLEILGILPLKNVEFLKFRPPP